MRDQATGLLCSIFKQAEEISTEGGVIDKEEVTIHNLCIAFTPPVHFSAS